MPDEMKPPPFGTGQRFDLYVTNDNAIPVDHTSDSTDTSSASTVGYVRNGRLSLSISPDGIYVDGERITDVQKLCDGLEAFYLTLRARP